MADNMNGKIYPGTFTEDDVFGASTVACPSGQYTLIGEYKVKADELVGLGRGIFASQNEAIGHLFATFYDNSGTPVQLLNGKLRIMLTSSQDIPIGPKPVCVDVDLAQLTTGATVPSDRFALPYDDVLLSRDRKIQFFIYNGTGSSVTLAKANSKVLCDITRALIA